MRTAKDFVDDMLSRKYHWTAILSVARVARGGAWAAKVKAILREMGVIPQSDDETNKLRDEALLKDKNRNEESKRREIERRKRERRSSTDPG